MAAQDGQSLNQQSPETQAAFQAAYGGNAVSAWEGESMLDDVRPTLALENVIPSPMWDTYFSRDGCVRFVWPVLNCTLECSDLTLRDVCSRASFTPYSPSFPCHICHVAFAGTKEQVCEFDTWRVVAIVAYVDVRRRDFPGFDLPSHAMRSACFSTPGDSAVSHPFCKASALPYKASVWGTNAHTKEVCRIVHFGRVPQWLS